MPRFCLTLVGLLAVLTAARGLAQTVPEANIQRLPPSNLPPATVPTGNVPSASVPSANVPNTSMPSANAPPTNAPTATLIPPPPSETPSPAAGEKLLSGESVKLDGTAKTPPIASLSDFVGYRYSSNSLDWIPGNGDRFGMFSIVFDHYQKAGYNDGLGFGMGFHFLSGPVQTDMPPIVYDFSLAYQFRKQLGPLGIDIAASVLEATDFKGNAGQGLQYPAHAVGYLGVGPTIDLAIGADYLDRGHIKLLPVAGLIWKPNPAMRFEAVFPRPRAVFQLTDCYRLYLAGELGGGSWSIERGETYDDDLATYQDLRVCIGLEHAETNGMWSALEVGYLFDRRIEYTSGIGDMRLDDAAVIRLVSRY